MPLPCPYKPPSNDIASCVVVLNNRWETTSDANDNVQQFAYDWLNYEKKNKFNAKSFQFACIKSYLPKQPNRKCSALYCLQNIWSFLMLLSNYKWEELTHKTTDVGTKKPFEQQTRNSENLFGYDQDSISQLRKDICPTTTTKSMFVVKRERGRLRDHFSPP